MPVLPPRPLFAASLLLLGGLAWAIDARPLPSIAPGDAARWEGQAVEVEGWVRDLAASDGSVRFRLADGADAVAARMPAGDGPPLVGGERIAVAGRLMRATGGDLLLLVDDASTVRRLATADAAEPGWDIAADGPAAWTGAPLRLSGTVERGRLRGPGHSVALGEGVWPSSGPVQAEGFLRLDAGCLCYVFDAGEVRPWTS